MKSSITLRLVTVSKLSWLDSVRLRSTQIVNCQVPRNHYSSQGDPGPFCSGWRAGRRGVGCQVGPHPVSGPESRAAAGRSRHTPWP